MKPKQFLSLITVILFLNITGQGETEDRKTIAWITKEEAALPPMKPTETRKKNSLETGTESFSINNPSMAGPIIKIKKPDPDQLYNDLIDVLILFDKNPVGEPVNMESLRIIYLKMLGIDITDRVRPYVKETRIDANGIMFPEGEHEFEVRIKDIEDMGSAKIFKVKVK